MKKWKCTVCGYVHTGDEPPDKCPVCGAPKNRFVEITEDGVAKPASTGKVDPPVAKPSTPPAPGSVAKAAAQDGGTMRKWKCTVCGYIHTGTEPPETCPVCGAPKNKFVEIIENGAPKTEVTGTSEPAATQASNPDPVVPPSRFENSKYRKVFDLLTRYHGHPISVHIPNGLLPVVVLFIVLSAVFNFKGMASAAVYNLGFVALSMPLVLFSGWVDWQNRFNGAVTDVFIVKIACGIVVTVTAWFLFIWLLIDPQVVTTPQPSRVAFFVINLIMLAAAGTAGWYGGKLVFRD